MSWLPQRWRTQRNAIRIMNCRTLNDKCLNAPCAGCFSVGMSVWVPVTKGGARPRPLAGGEVSFFFFAFTGKRGVNSSRRWDFYWRVDESCNSLLYPTSPLPPKPHNICAAIWSVGWAGGRQFELYANLSPLKRGWAAEIYLKSS